ncbi:IS66 family insertion sequence element accessory protein TnpB [Acidiferrobacter sp.]|uniref:IS66 family insertion sequence element accessory protein TnpB n=1 Tax=Acidiferrobacter sp. TaxID=1872107 RepID=UPI002604EACD|nr:IS66 family insertion sequence element accessory protein TnpB [Acidiferrobacter sp.]
MRMFEDPLAVYLHREPIDFRVGIDGLASRVEQAMAMSPLTGALFVFTNRARDKVKVLYWDQTGFALWLKRLEAARFAWPRKLPDAVLTLSQDQLQWLLAGYDITLMRPHAALVYKRVS